MYSNSRVEVVVDERAGCMKLVFDIVKTFLQYRGFACDIGKLAKETVPVSCVCEERERDVPGGRRFNWLVGSGLDEAIVSYYVDEQSGVVTEIPLRLWRGVTTAISNVHASTRESPRWMTCRVLGPLIFVQLSAVRFMSDGCRVPRVLWGFPGTRNSCIRRW